MDPAYESPKAPKEELGQEAAVMRVIVYLPMVSLVPWPFQIFAYLLELSGLNDMTWKQCDVL